MLHDEEPDEIGADLRLEHRVAIVREAGPDPVRVTPMTQGPGPGASRGGNRPVVNAEDAIASIESRWPAEGLPDVNPLARRIEVLE